MCAVVFKNHSIFNFDNFNNYHLNDKVLFKNAFLKDLFLGKNIFSQTPNYVFNIIEQYLENVRKEINDKCLSQCLAMISKDNNLTLSTLSKQTQIIKKTIIAHFKKYAGRTPASFIAVEKFRSSLTCEADNLTDLGYALGFFDQSHMIKSFKRLTGETPGRIQKKENLTKYSTMQWLK